MNAYVIFAAIGSGTIVAAYLGWRMYLLWFCREQYITYVPANDKDDDGMRLIGTLFMKGGYSEPVYEITKVYPLQQDGYRSTRLALYGRRHRP